MENGKKTQKPVNDMMRTGPKRRLLLPRIGLYVCMFIKILLLAILVSAMKKRISEAGCTTKA